jgi:predicted dehydrogenase
MIVHRHAGVLVRFEDVEVRAIADLLLERAEELAAHASAAAYPEPSRQLDAEDLEAVYGGRPRSC